MTTQPTTGGPRAVTLLTWCAVASLGLLFMKVDTITGLMTMNFVQPLGAQLGSWLAVAATAGALVAWHQAPQRAWAWLLLAGAVCTVPGRLMWFMDNPYAVGSSLVTQSIGVLTACAPGFTLVGIVGAATLVWRAGRQGIGAALLGSAMVIQLLGPVVLGSLTGTVAYLYGNLTNTVAGLILAAVAAGGALTALAVGPSIGPAGHRPAWQTTAGASVAAASPLLILVWQPDPTVATAVGITADVNYLLYVGLVFLAAGVVLGAVAGPRALLGAMCVGLLLGPFGMLIQPAVEVLRDMPVLGTVAAVGSVLLGVAAALTRWRDRIGAACLLLVFVGLIIDFSLFNSNDDPSSFRTFSEVLTPTLLVVSVVGAVTVIGAVGGVLAARGEAPAVFAGAATPFSLGAIALIAYFTLQRPPGKAPIVGLLPPAAGAILLSALALMLLVTRFGAPPAEPPPAEPPTEALHAGRSGEYW